jgi:hypothetical protein
VAFAPVKTDQVDWSHKVLVIDGISVTVKVVYVRTYPRAMHKPDPPSSV